MDDLISRQAVMDALDVLCQEHRYRIPGKRETYSQYNEAWQDALDRAESIIGNLPSAQPDRSLWFRIGEICVDESKGFISAGRAFEMIRELLRKAERKTDES